MLEPWEVKVSTSLSMGVNLCPGQILQVEIQGPTGIWDEWSNPIDKGHWGTEASRVTGWGAPALLPFTYFQRDSDFILTFPCLYPFTIPHEGGCSLTQEPRGTGLHDAILGRLEDGFGQRDGVTHHGTVEPVLSHHTAPAPALLPLPPFGPAVLEPNLEQATRRDMVFVRGEGMLVPFPCGIMHVLLQQDESRWVDAYAKANTTSSPMQKTLGVSPSLP